MVAPSFQSLEQLCDPFEENGKQYIYVLCKNGNRRKVRWYEEPMKKIRPTKEVLGFTKGYITIFKGDTSPLLEWFQNSTARYHTLWGWYFVSEDELPQIPEGITPVQLFWEDIADGDDLKPESVIKQHIDSLIYEPSTSQWQGEIGEKIDRTVTVTRVIPLDNGFYGPSTFYLFLDSSGNEYCWTTASKKLEAGREYKIRGSIKALQVYKGKNQTVLTRCRVEE